MKREKIIVSWLMLLAVMVLTVGCSDDSDERTVSGSFSSIELVPYASSYTEVEPLISGTRAPDWAPNNFYEYGDLTGVSGVLRSNEHAPISVYFTQDGPPAVELFRRFSYGSSNQKWRIDEEVEHAGNYYLYGFVPSSAGSASIEPNNTYADGAKLTLTGLNSVMTQDLCFVVGAKHGNGDATSVVPATESGKVALGDFECNIKAGESNYIYLLFDHLYAALRFRFRVDSKYAALRAIKLKKLELLAFQDETCTLRMSKKVQTTVTLRKTTNGTSPIVSVSKFTTDTTTPGGDAEMDWAVICDNESNPILLSGDNYTDNLGFVPKTSSFYHLRSTYDVYDLDAEGKPRNIVRQDCVAENKIDPRKQFNQEELERGNMYTLRLTINPTYLYVLSEPDLDNPTMVLE